MKRIAIIVVALFSSAAFAGSTANQKTNRTFIRDVTIVSPENLNHVTEGNVLIEAGRIVAVDRGKRATPPASATVVSGKGEFLIPGLIDSRVHLASVPGMDFDQYGSKPEMLTQYFKQLPRSYLYFGYTTLIDLAVFDRRVLDEFRQAPLHPD